MPDNTGTCWEDEVAEIHRLVVGALGTNVYALRCKATGAAVLIDGAGPPEPVLELCRRVGAGRVLQTHGHHDHVGAIPALRAAGHHVSVAAADAAMLTGWDGVVADGDAVEIGRLQLSAIATPGHTPGSMSYALVEPGRAGSPVVFVGDTLFPGGPGATRWPYSDFGAIIGSIDRQLFARFDDDTVVLPGHGRPTTIGAERPHLAEWAARGW